MEIKYFKKADFLEFLKSRVLNRHDYSTVLRFWKMAEAKKALMVMRKFHTCQSQIFLIDVKDYTKDNTFKPRFRIGTTQYPMPEDTHYVFARDKIIDEISKPKKPIIEEIEEVVKPKPRKKVVKRATKKKV